MEVNYLHSLWNPEVQCRIHKGSPIIPILTRINPITHIDIYLFKGHSNIVLPSTPKGPFSVGLPVKITSRIFKYRSSLIKSPLLLIYTLVKLKQLNVWLITP